MRRADRIPARALAALLCAVMLLGLAACGQDEDAGAPLRDGALFTVAVAQKPDSLNPYVSTEGLAQEFFLLVYDPLWRVNESGEAEPCLVDDWSLSSDRLTWTIRLRRDATFSDGAALTSADVQFSYELLRRSRAYADYFDGVTAIRCPDDYTVVISTEYVKADMLYNPTPILPRHLWRSYESAPGSFENTEMVGSGPFVFRPEESGEAGWMFRARAEHFGQTAELGAVFFALYGTVTGAARALAAGEADASYGLSDVQLTTLEGVPGVELIQAMLPGAACCGLAFNTRTLYFERDAVRQAVECCADRAWFRMMAFGDTGQTGDSFVSPGAEYYTAPANLRAYDLARAQTLLASAGFSDTTGDGKLEFRDGTPMVLTLYTSDADEWASTAATILTNDLESIGVTVNWRKTDGPVSDVCTPKADWDMCMLDWQGSLDAPLTCARFYDTVSSLTNWQSAEYESILNQLRTAAEDAEVRSYAALLQQRAYDDCPAFVWSYGVDIQAIRTADWTGFETVRDAAGGLFGIGSAAVYMKLAPADPAE